jgi:hypothetical protein
MLVSPVTYNSLGIVKNSGRLHSNEARRSEQRVRKPPHILTAMRDGLLLLLLLLSVEEFPRLPT